MAVFEDPLSLSVLGRDSTEEERWVTIGLAATAGLVLVAPTYIELGGEDYFRTPPHGE